MESSVSLALGVELEHPLPEEIQNMARDDTVCKFCGVSYLIHHEIKQLQNEIAELKRELALRESVVSENEKLKLELQSLKDDLTTSRSELESTKEKLTSSESSLKNTYSKVADLETSLTSKNDNICYLETQVQSLQQKQERLVEYLPGLLSVARSLKCSVSALRSEQVALQTEISSQLNESRTKALQTLHLSRAESDQLKRDVASYVDQLASVSQQLEQSQYSCAKLGSQLEEMAGVDKAYSQLKQMYETAQQHKSDMDALIAEKNEELRKKTFEVTQYQQINSSKDSEMENMKKQLEMNSASLHKSLQWYKDELGSKNKALHGLEQDLNSLRAEMKRKDEDVNEKLNGAEQTLTEYEKIKEAFLISKSENEDLRQEREVLIAGHQRRIEELQESFKQRLNSGGADFEMKLNEALENERNKFEREKQMIRDSMTQSHKIELEIERQKFEELQIKQEKAVEHARSEMITFAQEEAKRLQTTISALRRDLQVAECSCEQRVQSKQRELDLVTERLRKAEERMSERHQLELASAVEGYAQRGDNRDREQIQREKDELKTQLEHALSEVRSLQETVRRECEERLELTEALAEARETLLKKHLHVNTDMGSHQTMSKYGTSSNRLPQLIHSKSSDHVNANAPSTQPSVNTLPPKAPNSSSRGLQNGNNQNPTPPPPQPESRDGSHRSFTRRNSSQSRTSVTSNNSTGSQSTQDRTMAIYRAARLQQKGTSNSQSTNSTVNGNPGAKNEFKTMLNLAMRRGSSQ